MSLYAKHYPSRGSEHPPLILIHGLFGSHENLGAIARRFSEQFETYSIDLPNHGCSSHCESANLPKMAELVADWMKKAGFSQAYILGHSLGGKVAMELALTHSDLVNKLVVMDIAPVCYPPHHHNVFQGLLSLAPSGLSSRQEADKQLEKYVPEMPVRSFLLKNLVKTSDGGFSWKMNLAGLYADYPGLIQRNTQQGIFSGEVLFLKGGNSDYIQEKYWPEIVKQFPHASAKIVADTGHWLHAEKPDIVARLTTRFFEQKNR